MSLEKFEEWVIQETKDDFHEYDKDKQRQMASRIAERLIMEGVVLTTNQGEVQAIDNGEVRLLGFNGPWTFGKGDKVGLLAPPPIRAMEAGSGLKTPLEREIRASEALVEPPSSPKSDTPAPKGSARAVESGSPEVLTVLCTTCKREIYTISSAIFQRAGALKAYDFTPISAEIDPPRDREELNCPFCGRPFPEIRAHGIRLLTNKGMKP